MTYRRHPDLAWTESGQRIVIVRLSMLRAAPMMLEHTAMALWTMLDEPADVDGLTQRAAEAYGVAASEVRPDVQAWLRAGEAEGIVERL